MSLKAAQWTGHVKGIKLPFAGRSQLSWLKTSYALESNAILADAFDFDHIDNPRDGKNYISYDDGEAPPPTALKCMIIGSEKEHMADSDYEKTLSCACFEKCSN